MHAKQFTQKGNVLFYVLVAVALMAALSYAISQSTRGNLQQLSRERARLLASEIVEYSTIVANAVGQLRLRGVDDSDLCFNDEAWGPADYDHDGCSDTQNRIFHTDGGGVILTRPPEDAMNPADLPDQIWHFTAENAVQDVGTTCFESACAELIIYVDELRLSVCQEINKLIGIQKISDQPPSDNSLTFERFKGEFNVEDVIGDEAGGKAIKGETAGCFEKTGSPSEYVYYRVLIAR